MKPVVLSAALAIAFVAGVSVQSRPDFTGTWRIDPARSDKFSGGAPPETITVEGSKMTVSRTRAGNTASAVYMLDGTPSKNVSGPAGNQTEITYTSTWEGNVLVTTIPAPNLTRIERRSIEADGTMKVETTWNWIKRPPGASGPTEVSLMVFNKTNSPRQSQPVRQ